MDLYQRLGIKRGASEAEVKKAYRSLAKQLHPDRNQDNPKAAERFNQVTQAYDILSDKDKRARYDRGELDEEGNPKFGGFGGGGGKRSLRRRRIATRPRRRLRRLRPGGDRGFERLVRRPVRRIARRAAGEPERVSATAGGRRRRRAPTSSIG